MDIDLGLASPRATRRVVVAMAGTHQLWALDPVTGRARVHAGQGGEEEVTTFHAAIVRPALQSTNPIIEGHSSPNQRIYLFDDPANNREGYLVDANSAFEGIALSLILHLAPADGERQRLPEF